MNKDTNINIKSIVIDNNDKNNEYTREEKIKYLEDAIKNGGYYDKDGTWNSIAVFSGDKHIYRIRVETLIIKDNDYIFLKFFPKNNPNNTRTYTIPGGSTEKDMLNIDQAINECKEEARIIVRNIKSTGITYKETVTPPKWAIKSQPVNWNGNFTEVYIAEYDKKYTGHIDKVDEDKFMVTGKFYKLDKIFPYLKKEHQAAINLIYPNKFSSVIKTKNITESGKLDKTEIIDKATKILTDNGYTPIISKKSLDAFINNKHHIVSSGSNICISGFKNNEVINASELVNKELNQYGVYCDPDNYGTIMLYIKNDILTEKALTTEERNALDPHQFGIPSIRKFPIHDKEHVRYAISRFNTVSRKYEKELAYNIIKAMKHYGIDSSIVGDGNRLQSYLEID